MSTMMMASQTSGHRCNCGCSDCKGECCELECLVQPRFFCGQLLTDQDLTALLEWVKGKTALTRYRDGWGVACGLDVYTSAKPGKGGVVSVTPGYAIDCCGNDILVCEAAEIDLSKACLEDKTPCTDWPPETRQPSRGQTGAATGTTDSKVSFGGWQIPENEIQAVDLFIGYAESPSDARNALARRACDAVEACEYTRTHEGYYLYAKKAEYCEPAADAPAPGWETTYKNELGRLFKELQTMTASGTAKQKAERLSQWLITHALHSFSFVREWLCELQRSDDQSEEWLKKVLFWLVQDWRNHYFRGDCYGCGPETGVPLARVWLWRQPGERGKSSCKVIFINQYPPFRRPLRREGLPALPGQVNLARFVWGTDTDVVAELSRLGFTNILKRQFTDADFEKWRQDVAGEKLFAAYESGAEARSLVVYYYQDICQQNRVVRFGLETTPTRNPTRDPVTGVELTDKQRAQEETTSGGETAAPAVPANGPPVIENAEQVAGVVAGLNVPLNGAVENHAGGIDPNNLGPDDPLIEIQQISGIGPGLARRFETAGIKNLRDLANSDATTVDNALAGAPPHRPAIDFIKDASERLRAIQEGN